MMKIKKMLTIVSVFVFIVSLCALESESALPFITLFASLAWLVYMMRECDKVECVNNRKDFEK